MKNLRSILFSNSYFFAGFFLFFVTGLSYLLLTSKSASFLFLSSYHTGVLDNFFIVYTNAGDGLFSVAVGVLLLLLRRFNMALQVLTAYAISGLLAQLLKNLIYSPRPKEFFKFKQHIYLIDGVTGTGSSSFPSGHTASIFALVTMLAFFTKNKKRCWLYLVPAILVGYSRIYLAQHFLLDVLSGSLIGVLTAIFVYYFFTFKINGLKKNNRVKLADH
jgi:membrane-associated phospholipid phosphatase